MMNNFEKKPTKGVIVVTYPDEFSKKEIIGLVSAAGLTVARVMTQHYLGNKYGVGAGKAEEIKQIAEEIHSEGIIVDEHLTSSQAYRLSKLTGQNVIDRERLILNIFSKRATTSEGKLQVQLAELKYAMPRVKEEVNRSLSGEQQGLRGSGVSAVDVRFRDMKRQMSFIQKRLVQVAKQRNLFRNQREKLDVPLVSLVGYTSSGKTTLFNRLTSEEKEVASSLFTTLSTTTRIVELTDSAKILLSDTVGFISRLPTYMIEAFKSTLDELIYANIVLLLLDASESPHDMDLKYRNCWNVLRELKVLASKVVVVLNKSDLASADSINHAKNLTAESPSVVISAKCGDGTHMLKSIILQRLSSYLSIPNKNSQTLEISS
jgi:GTP-binding protein HflX